MTAISLPLSSIVERDNEVTPRAQGKRRLTGTRLVLLVLILLQLFGQVFGGGDDGEEAKCDCPALVTLPDCGNSDFPFLGGVDVVEYFSLDDDATGVEGKSKHAVNYNGYSFYFKDKKNKKLFKSNPSKYAPPFGGYCSWAVSGEFCSDGYPWAADCLGPSGNWGVWTIKRGKLFFFLKDTAKQLWLENVDDNIAAGEARWAEWFPDEPSYNTQCYMESVDALPSGSMSLLTAKANGTSEGVNLLSSSSTEEEQENEEEE